MVRARCALVACVVGVPVVSLVAGYLLGLYLMPATRPFADRDVLANPSSLNYSWYLTHNLSVTFAGGIGNQLFQYAALYGVAKANGLRPVVASQSLVARLFPRLRALRQQSTSDRPKSFLERAPNIFDGRAFSLNFMRNLELDGYFQSWRYFDHVRSDLRRQFTFPEKVESHVDSFLSDALRQHRAHFTGDGSAVQFVGVHVRRGDLASEARAQQGYTVAPPDYFTRAMLHFEQKFRHIIFVVTSDDPAWSALHVKSHTQMVVFSDWRDFPTYDLCLLARCNHTVMSTGTFGWWGGWLAGGHVVYYKHYPKPRSKLDKDFNKADYYLPQWVGV